MTAEAKYKAQLEERGIYDKSFDPAIHALCIEERELSRTMKQWKDTAPIEASGQRGSPSPLNPLYPIIQQQRKSIAALRESLGLTPKGYKAIVGKQSGKSKENDERQIGNKLDAICAKCEAYEF